MQDPAGQPRVHSGQGLGAELNGPVVRGGELISRFEKDCDLIRAAGRTPPRGEIIFHGSNFQAALSNPLRNQTGMKPSTILSALALVLVSEMRTNQKIADALRGPAVADATEPGASSGSELRDARNDLKRARL